MKKSGKRKKISHYFCIKKQWRGWNVDEWWSEIGEFSCDEEKNKKKKKKREKTLKNFHPFSAHSHPLFRLFHFRSLLLPIQSSSTTSLTQCSFHSPEPRFLSRSPSFSFAKQHSFYINEGTIFFCFSSKKDSRGAKDSAFFRCPPTKKFPFAELAFNFFSSLLLLFPFHPLSRTLPRDTREWHTNGRASKERKKMFFSFLIQFKKKKASRRVGQWGRVAGLVGTLSLFFLYIHKESCWGSQLAVTKKLINFVSNYFLRCWESVGPRQVDIFLFTPSHHFSVQSIFIKNSKTNTMSEKSHAQTQKSERVESERGAGVIYIRVRYATRVRRRHALILSITIVREKRAREEIKYANFPSLKKREWKTF